MCCSSFLQSPPLNSSCQSMQMLLVQLLQQLQGSTTTEDERLQRLLLTGCCTCLQSVCLQSAAANLHVSRGKLTCTFLLQCFAWCRCCRAQRRIICLCLGWGHVLCSWYMHKCSEGNLCLHSHETIAVLLHLQRCSLLTCTRLYLPSVIGSSPWRWQILSGTLQGPGLIPHS